jgi:hypothetical protein
MLRDTLYANIGETVELRCPYTSVHKCTPYSELKDRLKMLA